MTKQEELLIRRFKELCKAPIMIEPATVKSVDTGKLTCVVELFDETVINDVRLKAAIDDVTDALVQIPAVASTVLVALIGNNISVRFIIAFSIVDEVRFYNGENGGLPIWPDTKAQLDKVKDLLTQIVNVLNGSPIAEPGSGAPSALQTALKAAISGKPLPDFENLEDIKVKH